MWTCVSEHKSFGIAATAWKSEERDPIEETFSVGLFFGSYESRCLESSLLLAKNSVERSVIISFSEVDSEGLRDKHDNILLEQVRQCTRLEPEVVRDLSVQDVDGVLSEVVKRVPRPSLKGDQKWFFDITGSPKPYYMALLAWLRDRIECPSLTLFHAGGHYEKKATRKTAFSFTEGFSKYMWVPRLWGQIDQRLPWTYFFLLGFEGDRSIEIYDRFQPQYVTALIGRPGYRPDYTKVAEEENKDFIREARPDKIYANAADPVETWKKLERHIAAAQERSNVCIVPLGPKPHGLGGCLAALTNRIPAILYLMPKAYKVRDIAGGDRVWKYDIRL